LIVWLHIYGIADKPKGWLGLILGVRLYYIFHGPELLNDQAVFESRVDQVVREIADRGRPFAPAPASSVMVAAAVPEAVPPTQQSRAPAPAPTLAPAPAPAPALDARPSTTTGTAMAGGGSGRVASTPLRQPAQAASSPSLHHHHQQQEQQQEQQQQEQQQQQQLSSSDPLGGSSLLGPSHALAQQLPSPNASASASGSGGGGFSLADVAAFIKGEREEARQARLEWQAEAKALRLGYEAKLEQQREDFETRIAAALAEARLQRASEAIADEQLEGLQARLQALQSAKLLTEDELCCLEDVIGDCIEVMGRPGVQHGHERERGGGDVIIREPCVDQTLRMIMLTQKIKADAALARQLKRRFC
jgi:carbon monoxide dehydrogenase subunit G